MDISSPMAPRPETLTCCLSQVGIEFRPLKPVEVERVISEVTHRAATESTVGVEDVLHVLRPAVDLLSDAAPTFASAQRSSRQNFWRDAAEVVLGQTEGAALVKGFLEDPKVMATVDEELCLELLELVSKPNAAKRRRIDEPSTPGASSSSHAATGKTTEMAIIQRHSVEMEAMKNHCQEEVDSLLEKQKKEAENLIAQYKSMMDSALRQLHFDQKHQLLLLKETLRRRESSLRFKHLGDFFAPFLHISGRGHLCQGFYQLNSNHTRGWQPVYRKYKSRHYLYFSKHRWWISTELNMRTRQPRGLARSGAFRMSDSPARPEDATCWKVVGARKRWEGLELKLDELKVGEAEFVVASLAGNELLRQRFPLHSTVADIKASLRTCDGPEWNRPIDFIRLCLGSRELSNTKELGRLAIGAGECLQAILLPISCKHCAVTLETQMCPCTQCHEYLCFGCVAKCRECDHCVRPICLSCVHYCEYDFQFLCKQCAGHSECESDDDDDDDDEGSEVFYD